MELKLRRVTGSKPKLENIAEAVLAVRAASVPGAYLEAGVALGGIVVVLRTRRAWDKNMLNIGSYL